MVKGGGSKRIFQQCTDPSGQKNLYLRALQGHSGRNLIDPFISGQCLNSERFLRVHLSYRMCNNLHSIVNSGLIPGGQNLSKRQTEFFTSVDPMNKEDKDPDENDLNTPRLSWYKQKVWKQHQNTVYWVDTKLAHKKGFKFYQHDRTQSFFTTRFLVVLSRRLSWWNLEKSYTRKYMRLLDLFRRFP